jgi:hypothetical protein
MYFVDFFVWGAYNGNQADALQLIFICLFTFSNKITLSLNFPFNSILLFQTVNTIDLHIFPKYEFIWLFSLSAI